MKNLLLATIATALTLGVHGMIEAAPLEVKVERGIFTKHLDGKADKSGFEYNESNHLTGLELKSGSWGIQVAQFENSYYKDSVAIGAVWYGFESEHVSAGLAGGMVKGYKDTGALEMLYASDWAVYVAPQVSVKLLETEHYKVDTTIRLFGTALVGTVGAIFKF